MLFQKLQDIFSDIFDETPLTLRPDLTAPEVLGWDSINHINLVVAIEEAFSITLDSQEIRSMANVGDLVDILKRHGVSIEWPSDSLAH